MVLALAAAVATAQSVPPPAVNFLRDCVITLKGAYILMPPKAVMPDVDEIYWNPQGTKLIAFAHSQKAEIDVELQDLTQFPTVPPSKYMAIVDPKAMTATWITGMDNAFSYMSVTWPESGEFCLVQGLGVPNDRGEEAYQSYIVDVSACKARPLDIGSPFSEFWLEPFRDGQSLLYVTGGVVAAGSTPIRPATYVLDRKGNVAPLPAGLEQALSAGWMLSTYSDKLGMILARANGDLGTLSSAGEIQPLSRDDFMSDVRRRNGTAPIEPHLSLVQKRAKQGREAWLVAHPDAGVQPTALVCALTEAAELSPRMDAVAYTSQRMLWIRRLEFMDGEKAVLMRDDCLRYDKLEIAKEIGSALSWYSNFNDERFPTGDIVTALLPYASNRDIFDGFVFTLPQGKTREEIEDQSKTEAGYFRMPGGRIVVYVDSSAKWVPDK
jgi:hypothetical protein